MHIAEKHPVGIGSARVGGIDFLLRNILRLDNAFYCAHGDCAQSQIDGRKYHNCNRASPFGSRDLPPPQTSWEMHHLIVPVLFALVLTTPPGLALIGHDSLRYPALTSWGVEMARSNYADKGSVYMGRNIYTEPDVRFWHLADI